MTCAIGRDGNTVSTRAYAVSRRLTTEKLGSETIADVMNGYKYTSAGTTYDFEDFVSFSSQPPQAPSLPNASYIDEPVVREAAGTGGTLYYFHRNQQYSITAITTSAGAVTERYAYTAYGLPTILDASASVLSSSAISNRYGYTGREWDTTLALHHFRARWMSPFAGRFLGRDPIGYWDGMNLSEFVGGAPITFVDPNGYSKAVTPLGKGIHSHQPCGGFTTKIRYEGSQQAGAAPEPYVVVQKICLPSGSVIDCEKSGCYCSEKTWPKVCKMCCFLEVIGGGGAPQGGKMSAEDSYSMPPYSGPGCASKGSRAITAEVRFLRLNSKVINAIDKLDGEGQKQCDSGCGITTVGLGPHLQLDGNNEPDWFADKDNQLDDPVSSGASVTWDCCSNFNTQNVVSNGNRFPPWSKIWVAN